MVKSGDVSDSKGDAREKAIAAVKAVFERWFLIAEEAKYTGYDLKVMTDAKVLDASLGPPLACVAVSVSVAPSVVASSITALHIDASYANINEVMHGGAYGVIFDMLTTTALAVISRPGYWDFLGGVTRNLNISYLKGVPIGTTIHIHAYVYQVGRTLAYIKGWMTSEDGRTVYATCEHHKINIPTRDKHMKYKVKWDEQWDKDSKL